jgi:hypothetical protein
VADATKDFRNTAMASVSRSPQANVYNAVPPLALRDAIA